MEEVTVFVEFEPSSQKHLHFPLADSPQNEEIFNSCTFIHTFPTNFSQSRTLFTMNFHMSKSPELLLLKNSLVNTYSPHLITPLDLKQASNELVNEPFEIYLFGHLIFSRRKTGKAPNFPFLVTIIRKMIHEKFDNHTTNTEFTSQPDRLKTPFDLKDSKLPPLKANVNHRVQIRTGKRAYNKQLDYTSPLQGNGNDDSMMISSPVKMPANNNSVLVGTDLNRSGVVEKSRSPLQRRMKVTLENLKRAESQPIERERGNNSKGPGSPSKPLSPYIKRTTQRKVDQVETALSPVKVRSGQASPQYKVENLQRGRIRNLDRVNSHLTKLIESGKNTDSSEGSEGNSNRKLKARLKSASHPPNSKNLPLMQGSKSKKEDLRGEIQVTTEFIGIQKVICEDDDSVDEQGSGVRTISSGSHQQGTMLFRNTEEDIVENGSDSKGKEEVGEHVRATADFGQKFKEFMQPSPSTTKRLTVKAHQKSASRYSEVSMETEGYDEIYDVGVRERMLSFGEGEPSSRSVAKEVKEVKEVKEKSEGGKEVKEVKEKEVRKGKLELELEEKNFEYDGGTVMYKKGSTPQFAKSPHSEIRE